MCVFDYEKIKNPGFFKENCLPLHSDHLYFRNEQEFLLEESSFFYSLRGLWKFHYAKNYASCIPGFEKREYPCLGWDEIHVPAHIQMEGYDVPQYANVQYPWEGREDIRPGQIPEFFNPVASYVKYFTVPKHMEGEPLCIAFEGVESAFALWLNGEYIGYHSDSFTTAEFDLTKALWPGENKLAVQVFKWSAGSWCEDQDFFRFSGIYRDVYLFTRPEVHVEDLRLQALPAPDLSSGLLQAAVKCNGKGRGEYFLSFDGKRILQGSCALGETCSIEERVEAPRLWSAETPHLYTLVIKVYDQEGQLREIIKEQVGFRRFEIKDSVMYLNNQRIVFRGVNRHDFSSIFGRAITKEEMEKDLRIMKQNNINGVRTSHYPNSSWLYRLCDRYGLYVIDECNMETHGSWSTYSLSGDLDYVLPKNQEQWQDLLLERVRGMVERDKNHPSILIWSCGNESFGGRVIYEMSQLFRRLDPHRPVHYEGIFNDRSYPDTSDIESQMYTPAEEIQTYLKEHRDKPFICCEYAHCMGNSLGAMYKYTDLADTEVLYQGGFIWDYIDQAIVKKDRYGREFPAYGGDFKDRPTDYQFSANGLVYARSREPKPNMQEVKFLYQSLGILVEEERITIQNKNLFVNTKEFFCEVRLERYGKLLEKTALETEVPPLSQGTYPLPIDWKKYPGETVLTVSFLLKEDTPWAGRGHEVAFGQGVFGKLLQAPPALLHPPGKTLALSANPLSPEKLQVIRSPHNIGVRGEDFEVIFSYLQGGLVSYRYGGREMLETVPRPNFWRAPTDNDMGNLMPMRYAQWKTASMYASTKNPEGPLNPEAPQEVEIQEEKDRVQIAFTYFLPTIPRAFCRQTHDVFADGRVQITLEYDPVKELGDMPEFGVMMKLNADFNRLCWYGLGPEDTYQDRKKGGKLGVYEKNVEENLASYVFPQESGSKEGVRVAAVTDEKGRGLCFWAEKAPMSFSALPWTPHEIENAAHGYELPPVHYTVVRAALARMGVAGDNSWGARTHPEFLLNTEKKMVFCFSFKGI